MNKKPVKYVKMIGGIILMKKNLRVWQNFPEKAGGQIHWKWPGDGIQVADP